MPAGTILIVDDMPTNLQVLTDLLVEEGFEVLVATDGESALEQASYAQPDIILLDVMMPGIDGFETCRRLKSQPDTLNIPVIFMTSLTDTINKVHGFEVGAADYVTKPLQHEEALARINAHLTLYRQRQEIERLHQQERRAFEQLSQMKDEILHTASHDLKNPISSITMSLHLLQRHLPAGDTEAQDYIHRIEGDVDRMLKLITNVLDLARLETGQALHKEAISLHYLLQENHSNFAAPAQQKDITLQLALPAEDVTLSLDPQRMSQVLQNLLSNALKYTPAGGTVTLEADMTASEVLISVRDSGLGIPAEDQPYVFDKFYRVKSAEHQQVSGTGLGLSIVKAIVEQHGGTIEVASTQGAVFTVRLPR